MAVAQRTTGKRWVWRGVAAVALGVVTTLVIAWPATVGAVHLGWAREVLVAHGTQAYAKAGGGSYRAMVSARLLSDCYQLMRQHPRDSRLPLGDAKPLPGWVQEPAEAPGDLRESVNYGDTWATGLPWRCVASETWFVWTRRDNGSLATAAEILRPPTSGTITVPIVRHGWTVGTGANGPTVVPLRVVWGGLIADTAAWTAVWMVVVTGAVVVRSSQRRRRGCCAQCGYDRRGLAGSRPCPECGAVGAAGGVEVAA